MPFCFSAANNSNAAQREISRFIYAKLSYELGYQDEALRNLRSFLDDYPATVYKDEATDLLVRALTNTNNYREALTLLDSLKYPSASPNGCTRVFFWPCYGTGKRRPVAGSRSLAG
jgi:tetratricopeptide (TPR) repeat protein